VGGAVTGSVTTSAAGHGSGIADGVELRCRTGSVAVTA
jgi:hypothetical protein